MDTELPTQLTWTTESFAAFKHEFAICVYSGY